MKVTYDDYEFEFELEEGQCDVCNVTSLVPMNLKSYACFECRLACSEWYYSVETRCHVPCGDCLLTGFDDPNVCENTAGNGRCAQCEAESQTGVFEVSEDEFLEVFALFTGMEYRCEPRLREFLIRVDFADVIKNAIDEMLSYDDLPDLGEDDIMALVGYHPTDAQALMAEIEEELEEFGIPERRDDETYSSATSSTTASSDYDSLDLESEYYSSTTTSSSDDSSTEYYYDSAYYYYDESESEPTSAIPQAPPLPPASWFEERSFPPRPPTLPANARMRGVWVYYEIPE